MNTVVRDSGDPTIKICKTIIEFIFSRTNNFGSIRFDNMVGYGQNVDKKTQRVYPITKVRNLLHVKFTG